MFIGAAITLASLGPAYPETPDRVSQLELPVTISHRGGADVYPEESMEGFTTSARDGFLPEMDIQFLADGTPVLIHDDTVDRTLDGVSGEVSDLSLEEWDSAKIKHPTGGPTAETVTLNEALDELGGKVVMVPEIKPEATSAEVDQVLDEFDERGLEDSLIVQSFDFATAKSIAERGYTSLYLFGTMLPSESAAQIAGAGIEWVGPSAKLPNSDLRTLIEAGLHVAPYTMASAEDGRQLPHGIGGFFTDDPWTK
ncbi:glycerophosphodiester phosphodiesterase [Brevibacterium sp. CBA3109]|uniref:Glycerophosphodiester phosphodiesterase n=1 Tax=Brevibacterium koreense TaxID=3140787 RepID=A0AAU7UJ81_9MICO